MSLRTRTGLAPEITRFTSFGMRNDDGSMHNALRPETVESLFYFWRLDRNQLWLEGVIHDVTFSTRLKILCAVIG